MHTEAMRQLMEQLEMKFRQIDGQLAEIMKALPALSQQSTLDAEKKTAEIRKIQAETMKLSAQAEAEQIKQSTNRAKVIADIEGKQREQMNLR